MSLGANLEPCTGGIAVKDSDGWTVAVRRMRGAGASDRRCAECGRIGLTDNNGKSMNTQYLSQLLTLVDHLLPFADPIAKKTRDIGSVAKPLLRDAAIALADIRADIVNHYMNRGFTREEAITMTLADMASVRDALKNREKA